MWLHSQCFSLYYRDLGVLFSVQSHLDVLSVFVVTLSLHRQMLVQYLRTGHDHFLLHPFQFKIHNHLTSPHCETCVLESMPLNKLIIYFRQIQCTSQFLTRLLLTVLLSTMPGILLKS